MSAPTQRWWHRFLSRRWLLASLLLHAALLGAAALWTGRPRREAGPPPPAFRLLSPASQAARHAPEHRLNPARRHGGGAPPVPRRVVTSGLSPVALPDFPALSAFSAPPRPEALVGRYPDASGRAGSGHGAGSGPGSGGSDPSGRLANLLTVLRVREPRVGIILDASGGSHLNPELQALRTYIRLSFDPHLIFDFNHLSMVVWTGVVNPPPYSMGMAIMDLLNSGQPLDAVYVLSGFGGFDYGTRQASLHPGMGTARDLWPLIQEQIRKRHLKLYLHIVCPSNEAVESSRGPSFRAEVIAFARSTGGVVKLGPLPAPGEEISAPAPASRP